MGRKSKKAKRNRKKAEFNPVKLARKIQPPIQGSGADTWTLAEIMDARDQQLVGNFRRPVALAASMRTDPALFTAYHTRLAPQQALDVEMKASGETAASKMVTAESEGLFGIDGVGVTKATLSNVNGDLANHGVAIGCNVPTHRPDGSRVDLRMNYWPLQWVRWDEATQQLWTQVDTLPGQEPLPPSEQQYHMSEMPIVHGDGRWTVFAKFECEPWRQDAAILPGCLVWARHAHALRDWSKGSTTHANAKIVGAMPEGVALSDEEGNMTNEAAAFLTLLQAIASLESPVGIKPFGADLDYIVNNSTAWQVYKELVDNGARAAARIYLGTDGILGTQGGAPGIDISQLFGVATTRIQGDLEAIETGLLQGLIEPWAAMNFGSSALAPKRLYLIPDVDADGEVKARGAKRQAFYADIKEQRDNGFQVTQQSVNKTAKEYKVDAPKLPPETGAKAPSITLAPTDVAKVVMVNEARASAGLGELKRADGSVDPDGLITVDAFAKKNEAKGDVAVVAAEAEAEPAPAAQPEPALPAGPPLAGE
jgi:hypothetical protein